LPLQYRVVLGVWTSTSVVALLAAILLGFGGLLLSNQVGLNEMRSEFTDCTPGEECVIEIVAHDHMKDPKLYYEVQNFYGNHRTFVKSVSWNQLRGDKVNAQRCGGITDYQDLMDFREDAKTSEGFLNPCGAVAKYFFSDKPLDFKINHGDWETLSTNDTVRNSDRVRFHSQESQWTDTQDANFITWMKMPTLPTFRHLFAHMPVNTTIEQGDVVQVKVEDNWREDMISARKFVVLMEVGDYGSGNLVLSSILIASGLFYLGLFCVLHTKHVKKEPRFTDLNF
jgi:hypothetical protein